MSLISEALRKARQQAAEEGDQRRGVFYSWSPAARPRGTRLGLGLVLGATIALGAALAGAGAVWWVVGHREQPEAIALASSADAPPPADAPHDQLAGDSSATAVSSPPLSAPSTLGGQPGSEEGDALAPRTERTAESIRDTPPESRSDQSQPTPASEPGSTARQSDRSAGVHAESPTIGPDGERIYLIEADLGGVTLTLDFIVFRPDDPFAEINGLDVHVGSSIEGFTVEAIERNHVRLRNQEGVLILRAP